MNDNNNSISYIIKKRFYRMKYARDPIPFEEIHKINPLNFLQEIIYPKDLDIS